MSRTITLRPRREPLSVVARGWQRVQQAIRGVWIGPHSLKDPAFAKLYGAGWESSAGVQVTQENAFTFSAVYDAVNMISSDTAKLPLNLHKRRKNGGSDHFTGAKLYKLLKQEPNPEQTSMVFRRTLLAHALTCQGGFAEIERDPLGRPAALWILTPDRVEPIRFPDARGKLGPLVYRIDGNNDTILQSHDVLHIHGLGYDGYTGYGVINKARQAIGLALAAERFGSTYFGKGTMFGGWLETEDDLDEIQKGEIKDAIEAFRKSQDAAFRILVTGMGHKFHQFTSKPSDSQMDELRIRQVEEVARFFRIPPHRLGVNTPGTVSYASVEAANLDYYTGCLLDWLTLVEQEFNRKLIPALEQSQQFIKHNVNALLRGTIKDRFEALGIARDKGIINANEWRELEDMNPQEGEQGSKYLVQSAQIPADMLAAKTQSEIDKNNEPTPAPVAPAPSNDRDLVLLDAIRQNTSVLEAQHAEAQQAVREAIEAKATAEQATALAVSTAESERQRAELLALEAVEATTAAASSWTAKCEAEDRRAESEARAATLTTAREQAEETAASAQAEADRLSQEASRLESAAAVLTSQVTGTESERDAALQAAEGARRDAEQVRTLALEAQQRQQEAEAEKAHAVAEQQAALELVAEAKAAVERSAAEALKAQQLAYDAAEARTDAEQRATEAETQRADAVSRLEASELAASEQAVRLLAVTSERDAALAAAETRATDAKTARTEADRLAAEALAAAVERAESAEQALREAAEGQAEILTVAEQAKAAADQAEAAMKADAEARAESDQAKADEIARAKAEADRLAAEVEIIKAALAETTDRAEREAVARVALEGEFSDRLVRQISAHRRNLVSDMGRVSRRQTEKARRHKATPQKLRRWLDGVDALEESLCVELLVDAVSTHLAWKGSTDDPVAATTTLVRAHLDEFRAQMLRVIDAEPEDFHAELEKTLERWESSRPETVADAFMAEEIAYVRARRSAA